MTQEFRLTSKCGFETIVDEDIYMKYKDRTLSQYNDYAVINSTRLSHLIVGKPKQGYVVDHANRIKNDNRRCNLRHITSSENAQNQNGRGVSHYKNVTPRSGKWAVQVQKHGVSKYGGLFDDELHAAYQANCLMKELYGDTANLNCDEEGNEIEKPQGFEIKEERPLPKHIYRRKALYAAIITTHGKTFRRSTETIEDAVKALKEAEDFKKSIRLKKEAKVHTEIQQKYDDYYVCTTTNKKYTFKISRREYEKIKLFKCYKSGTDGAIILFVGGGRKEVLHRYLLDATCNGKRVIHLNGDVTDNRYYNLKMDN